MITSGAFGDHLNKVKVASNCLQAAKLRVNVKKSYFELHEIEKLGYVLTCDGRKPQPEKVSTVLVLGEPKNLKEVRRFLVMVQYYHDVWVYVDPT